MYSPEITVCSSWTPDFKPSTPQTFLPKFSLGFGYQKLSHLITMLDTPNRVLPDYRSLKDLEFLTHFDFMSIYSDWNRWGKEFVISSQFNIILKLPMWALKLRTDMVQSHWGGKKHTQVIQAHFRWHCWPHQPHFLSACFCVTQMWNSCCGCHFSFAQPLVSTTLSREEKL